MCTSKKERRLDSTNYIERIMNEKKNGNHNVKTNEIGQVYNVSRTMASEELSRHSRISLELNALLLLGNMYSSYD